nr:hypothetical protein [Acetobacter oeni]
MPLSVVTASAQVNIKDGVATSANDAVGSAVPAQDTHRYRVRGAKKHSVAPKENVTAPGSSESAPNASVAGEKTAADGVLPPGWRQDKIGVQQDKDVQSPAGTSPASPGNGSPALLKNTLASANSASRDGADGSPAPGVAGQGDGGSSQLPSHAQISKIFLPMGDGAGIAAFWSRNDFIIVSDHATQLDAGALKDTGPFSSVEVRTPGGITVVTFHFDGRQPLTLSRQPGGWILAVTPKEEGGLAHLSPEQKDGGILYRMPQPGRIVELSDPASGARLLVATSLAKVPGPRLPHRHVGYEIWPSLQGLVFAVESDQIEVRDGGGGPFLDAVGKGAIPLANGASGRVVDDRVDWSWLGLRSLSPAALREDYRRHWTQAAMLPPENRNEARLAAARSAFALGDAHNARAILATATQDDPELALLPNVAFLRAASELLAGNVAGASVLDSADTGEDGALWRGLYMERAGNNPAQAASLLAGAYSRLADYPVMLRDRLQPEAAAFIAQYGSDQDRSVLSPLPVEPAYGAAKAFLELRAGDQNKALASFQLLAKKKDPVLFEAGCEQAIGLRLAMGQLHPAEAADAYELLIPTARQVGREDIVRQAEVSALMQAGQWQKALAAADEQMRVFPDGRAAMVSLVQDILLHLAESSDGAGSHQTDAIDSVALIESHIDQIPDGPVKGRILAGLGAKLWGLGLPGRAALAFERALPLAPGNDQRAAWGGELARADIEAQRLGQARRALDETADPAAGGDIASRRRVIAASLLAKEGNKDQALQMLAQDESDQSLDLRGRLLEEERKWPDAVLVVGRLATKNIPEQGTLTDMQQDMAVRLATDAARANDGETLDRLREWVGRRRMTPERIRVFDLLVTSPEDDIRRRAGGP